MQLKSQISLALLCIILSSSITVASAGTLSKSCSISVNGSISVPSRQIMLGAWLGESAISAPDVQESILIWEDQCGKGLAWYAIMSNFGTVSNPEAMRHIDDYKGLILEGLIKGVIYTWQPSHDWNWGLQSSNTAYNGECIDEIILGEYDNYILNEANRCKEAGYPIIIRFGHEMNTYWAGWGANSTEFKQAWIHIVNIFRSADASNVKFFWCPNYNDNPSTSRFQDYYPGDQYVDYVGIDLYANNDWGWWANPEIQICNPNHNVYDTYPNKPYIIGEWGCSNVLSDQQNAAWVNSLFTVFEQKTRIETIVHWRGNQDGWRVDQYPQAFSSFKAQIADNLYTDNLRGWN